MVRRGLNKPLTCLMMAVQWTRHVGTWSQRPSRTYSSPKSRNSSHGLDVFGVDPSGWICFDAGASTGGFTDCLLQGGAARVYAVDVGTNQLHWKLRSDPRVVSMEQVNLRTWEPSRPSPSSARLLVADLSFISLRLAIPPHLRRASTEDAEASPPGEAPVRKQPTGAWVPVASSGILPSTCA